MSDYYNIWSVRAPRAAPQVGPRIVLRWQAAYTFLNETQLFKIMANP